MLGSEDTLALPGPRSRPATAAALAAVAALLLAAVGAYLAGGMVRTGRQAAALERDAAAATGDTAAIGQDVATSFGVVAVEAITRSRGTTARSLAGVTHGIQSLVPPDKVQVNATVTLTNLRPAPVRYAPSSFWLHATRGGPPRRGARTFRLVRSSVPPGTLQPDASIEATLTFVAPRDGSRLWMTFQDPARAPPVVFDLGRTDRARAGAGAGEHDHLRPGGGGR